MNEGGPTVEMHPGLGGEMRASALELMRQEVTLAQEEHDDWAGGSEADQARARSRAVEWALVSIAESLARIATMQ